MSAPLTCDDLDARMCLLTEPYGAGMLLRGSCHPRASLDVVYCAGVLTMRCGECASFVAEIRVAQEGKPS